MKPEISGQFIAVMSAGAAGVFGFDWRVLTNAFEDNIIELKPVQALAGSHPGTLGAEVPSIPKELDAGDIKVHRQMSRAARLAAICARRALKEAGFEPPRDNVAYFLGVGASGGAMSDLQAVIKASLEGEAISMRKFGEQGLLASNPVGTFQLLNNFTLCHSAILEGTGGANGAFFSRGGGTVIALREAIYSLLEGDCEKALAGGADSALHPVTWAELLREGFASRGFIPGEGAALLSLQIGQHIDAIAYLQHCSLHDISIPWDFKSVDEPKLKTILATLSAGASEIDWIGLVPWGAAMRQALQAAASERFPNAIQWDITKILGDSLAASPALGWAAALSALNANKARHAVIISAGMDGQLGICGFSRNPCAFSPEAA